MKTALIAGSTGLIGNHLLHVLLESDRYSNVLAITRKDLDISHPKLVQLKFEMDQLSDHSEELKADDIYCCLGTTMAKAGSKEKFYAVDYLYSLALAKATLGMGAKQFLLVSALGANKSSSIYYNSVKGQIEEAISAVGFLAVHIFRPSLLLGHRSEKRPGEDAAKFFYKVFGFLIPEKYKGIDAAKVARAMLHFGSREQTGIFIHESRDMQSF